MWQRSFNELSQIPQTKRSDYRTKRKTKTELTELYQNKNGGKMPEYNTSVLYNVRKDEIYEIISVDEITTRNNLQGISVSMKSRNSNDKREYGETLWPGEQVSATSRWGSFVSVLGSNTDTWPHKWIKVISWQNRLCEIQLVPAPKPIAKKD